ncbi:MAG TPA: response regulator [Candidatus Lokiarchaeia archaeon]
MVKEIHIIDDNNEILKLLTLLIQFEIPDSVILTETHGTYGLNLIKSGNPDLIILDIVLPGMNGEEICKELRKINKYKEIPIFAFTGLDLREEETKTLKSYFNEIVSKNIELSDFIALIRKYIYRS